MRREDHNFVAWLRARAEFYRPTSTPSTPDHAEALLVARSTCEVLADEVAHGAHRTSVTSMEHVVGLTKEEFVATIREALAPNPHFPGSISDAIEKLPDRAKVVLECDELVAVVIVVSALQADGR